ncbi:MAG: DUF5686 family protein [Bacteroidia bacterium]
MKVLLIGWAWAQVTGTLLDKVTEEPLPFIRIYVVGSSIGTQTNLDGNFSLSLPPGKYTLRTEPLGYEPLEITLNVPTKEHLILALTPKTYTLQTVQITPKDNFADYIIRRVMEERPKNRPDRWEALEYQAYNKILLVMDNIRPKDLQNPLFKPLKSYLEAHKSLLTDTNHTGKYRLPLFFSETFTQTYLKKGGKKREVILASRSSGIENPEKNLLSNLLLDIQLYDNILYILGKGFTSPIGRGAFVIYNYYLAAIETTQTGIQYVVQLYPKNPQDLAFTGQLFIDAQSWALRGADLSLNPRANINFVDQIRIHQTFEKYDSLWVRVGQDIWVDFEQVRKGVGFQGRYTTLLMEVRLNQPHPDKFYEGAILSVDPQAPLRPPSFWQAQRPIGLDSLEVSSFVMMDSLRAQPLWKWYLTAFEALTTGRKDLGLIEVGPYSKLFSSTNTIEKYRLQLGFNTTPAWSRKFYLAGYVAYGVQDHRWKGMGELRYRIRQVPRLEIRLQSGRDLEQAGMPDFLEYAVGAVNTLLLLRPLSQLNYYTQHRLSLYSDLTKNLSCETYWRYKTFEPAFPIEFRLPEGTFSHYHFHEVGIQARLSYKENFILRGGERVYLYSSYPKLYLQCAYGITPISPYLRAQLTLQNSQELGVWGVLDYKVQVGKIYSQGLPYPQLEVYWGNPSRALNFLIPPYGAIVSLVGNYNYTNLVMPVAFNLLNFYEFVSDAFITGGIEHHVGGLFFNRVPLLRRWHLKEVWGIRAAYGTLSRKHEAYHTYPLKAPNPLPYIEAGMGIENIFRLLRIDAYWRLTYVHSAPRWGLRFNAVVQF